MFVCVLTYYLLSLLVIYLCMLCAYKYRYFPYFFFSFAHFDIFCCLQNTFLCFYLLNFLLFNLKLIRCASPFVYALCIFVVSYFIWFVFVSLWLSFYSWMFVSILLHSFWYFCGLYNTLFVFLSFQFQISMVCVTICLCFMRICCFLFCFLCIFDYQFIYVYFS